jgi:hypothetical protein
MKSITLYQPSGKEITFFLSEAQSFVIMDSEPRNSCKLIDGIHNNGGWHIAESASSLKTKLNALFHPRPVNTGPK